MLRRKQKRQIEQYKSEDRSSKICKKDSASENSDDEDERTLEKLVFGGENDAIREFDKDFTEDQGTFRFYSSSDEVRNSLKTHTSLLIASSMYSHFGGKVSISTVQTLACIQWIFIHN